MLFDFARPAQHTYIGNVFSLLNLFFSRQFVTYREFSRFVFRLFIFTIGVRVRNTPLDNSHYFTYNPSLQFPMRILRKIETFSPARFHPGPSDAVQMYRFR